MAHSFQAKQTDRSSFEQRHGASQSTWTPKRKFSVNREHTFRSMRPCSDGLASTVAVQDEVGLQNDASVKLVIFMVGLPARGKSYVTKKLCRYLNWLQHDARIFNVGDRRRKLGRRPIPLLPYGQHHDTAAKTAADYLKEHSANFFDPENKQAKRLREQAAMETLDELLDYLIHDGGSVALFDATNSTIECRDLIMQKVRDRGPELQIMFLESQCFDEDVRLPARIRKHSLTPAQLLESNMRLKLSGPDYKDEDPVSSFEDFKKRVAMYEKNYVPLGAFEERNGYSYCQMIDVGRKFVIHNISGFLATQAVHYLQHFNLLPRQIWLTRHGESYDDVVGRIGGDAELTPYGVKYASALSKFINHQKEAWKTLQEGKDGHNNSPFLDTLRRSPPADQVPKTFDVWTSKMQRSMQTAQFFAPPAYQTKHLRMLDELNAGVLEGLTREEVKAFYSDWYNKRRKDKFCFRYPGTAGEGYLDVTNRLKSVILEVERVTCDVLLISGLAVTRILLAYFRGLHRDHIVDLNVPLGTLYVLEPRPYGVDYRVYIYNPEKDWFDLSI
ncbi:6-phosphofructo-2-kinase [Exophiala xenobiotica]